MYTRNIESSNIESSSIRYALRARCQGATPWFRLWLLYRGNTHRLTPHVNVARQVSCGVNSPLPCATTVEYSVAQQQQRVCAAGKRERSERPCGLKAGRYAGLMAVSRQRTYRRDQTHDCDRHRCRPPSIGQDIYFYACSLYFYPSYMVE